MSNFILKPFNDTRYEIRHSRELVGSVVKRGEQWEGVLNYEGTTVKVRNFSDKSNAFHALAQALKVEHLKKRFPDLTIEAVVVGTKDVYKDAELINQSVRDYCAAWNLKNPQRPMHIVQPRRRRR